MPKFPTFPTLFDEVLQLEASQLKKWGYLESNEVKSGIVTWSTNGSKTASISIVVNDNSELPFMELDYKYGSEPRNYKVYFDRVPSNLGKGYVWYFVCPETKKRCRKLYNIGGYFLHREAFRGCMYEKQTHSKKWREMEKLYGAYFDSDKLYSELYSKNFRKYYNGKATKRYLRIMEQIQLAERVSIQELEQLMLS